MIMKYPFWFGCALGLLAVVANRNSWLFAMGGTTDADRVFDGFDS
jgi:hypothetical protein